MHASGMRPSYKFLKGIRENNFPWKQFHRLARHADCVLLASFLRTLGNFTHKKSDLSRFITVWVSKRIVRSSEGQSDGGPLRLQSNPFMSDVIYGMRMSSLTASDESLEGIFPKQVIQPDSA